MLNCELACDRSGSATASNNLIYCWDEEDLRLELLQQLPTRAAAHLAVALAQRVLKRYEKECSGDPRPAQVLELAKVGLEREIPVSALECHDAHDAGWDANQDWWKNNGVGEAKQHAAKAAFAIDWALAAVRTYRNCPLDEGIFQILVEVAGYALAAFPYDRHETETKEQIKLYLAASKGVL